MDARDTPTSHRGQLAPAPTAGALATPHAPRGLAAARPRAAIGVRLYVPR